MDRTTFSDIEKPFVTDKSVRGGVLFLESEQALQLIQEAKKANVQILGIDTFILTDSSIRPLIDHILDLTSVDEADNNSWDAASSFIRERVNEGFHFEVVLDN